ncbi:sensor histidine kinase [Urechidicola croceus]|uniref:histidine kinase n=1 Tax=Urechidicola croceus TaxID=1850246 RepID=A0A1D8P8R3_9FLAO|nr:HAMP domain-containing sensor histidine kinase [Urechidicola croceus]AOW20960.1 hypothetical protein LPB138_09860 [Urechidicola croceus]
MEITKDKDKYIQELEDKIVSLKFNLSNKDNELKSIQKNHKKLLNKLVHNLKNPVGAIYSFSEMILEDIEEYSTQKMVTHLNVINSSADFSIQLLNNVINYSRVQALEENFEVKNYNYIELIEDVISDFYIALQKKEITLKKEFPKTEIILPINSVELKSALVNVIHNAIRYSPKNTTIEISIKNNIDTITTSITDYGIGISETNLPLVFDDFFVVNTYSEDKEKCIGLGLTIAKKIISIHNGTITIESSENNGTTIQIELPKR